MARIKDNNDKGIPSSLNLEREQQRSQETYGEGGRGQSLILTIVSSKCTTISNIYPE